MDDWIGRRVDEWTDGHMGSELGSSSLNSRYITHELVILLALKCTLMSLLGISDTVA